MSDRSWVDVPKVKGARVDSRKVTGAVDLTFNGGGRVYATTDNAAPVMFRDKPYSVSVHYVRAEDGSFGLGDHVTVRLAQQFNLSEAARTIKAAVVAAVADTVEQSWTVARDEAASRARASRQLHGLESDLREAQQKVAELQAEILPLRRLLGEV
jgi:hypothetical protein